MQLTFSSQSSISVQACIPHQGNPFCWELRYAPCKGRGWMRTLASKHKATTKIQGELKLQTQIVTEWTRFDRHGEKKINKMEWSKPRKHHFPMQSCALSSHMQQPHHQSDPRAQSQREMLRERHQQIRIITYFPRSSSSPCHHGHRIAP